MRLFKNKSTNLDGAKEDDGCQPTPSAEEKEVIDMLEKIPVMMGNIHVGYVKAFLCNSCEGKSSYAFNIVLYPPDKVEDQIKSLLSTETDKNVPSLPLKS